MIKWLDIYKPDNALQPLARQEILRTNLQSQQYGLELTPLQAMELLQTRNRALKSHGRVEIGIEVIKKIAAAFCSSPHIHPHEYASTLNELLEIFYYMKNETEDSLGDDELITLMRELFDNQSRGAVELLRDRDLELYARELRSKKLHLANYEKRNPHA